LKRRGSQPFKRKTVEDLDICQVTISFIEAPCVSKSHGALAFQMKKTFGRGRDAGFPASPAQIPACGTITLGSYLGSSVKPLKRVRMIIANSVRYPVRYEPLQPFGVEEPTNVSIKHPAHPSALAQPRVSD